VPRTPPPSATALQCKIRLRDELHRRINAAAKQNRISKNEEVINRLERSFDRDPLTVLVADVKKLIALHDDVRK
jgi:hypothetical protein